MPYISNLQYWYHSVVSVHNKMNKLFFSFFFFQVWTKWIMYHIKQIYITSFGSLYKKCKIQLNVLEFLDKPWDPQHKAFTVKAIQWLSIQQWKNESNLIHLLTFKFIYACKFVFKSHGQYWKVLLSVHVYACW